MTRKSLTNALSVLGVSFVMATAFANLAGLVAPVVQVGFPVPMPAGFPAHD